MLSIFCKCFWYCQDCNQKWKKIYGIIVHMQCNVSIVTTCDPPENFQFIINIKYTRSEVLGLRSYVTRFSNNNDSVQSSSELRTKTFQKKLQSIEQWNKNPWHWWWHEYIYKLYGVVWWWVMGHRIILNQFVNEFYFLWNLFNFLYGIHRASHWWIAVFVSQII